MNSLNIGFAKMHLEEGERRDFLPGFVSYLAQNGWKIKLEKGLGADIGLDENTYLNAAPSVDFVDQEEIYKQDYVIVLRYPGD